MQRHNDTARSTYRRTHSCRGHTAWPTLAIVCVALIGCGQASRAAPDTDGIGSGASVRENGAAAGGSIAGKIAHPTRAVPAMRICAIGSGAPEQAKRVCVRTRRGQTSYRIVGLSADEYIVVAQTDDGDSSHRLGGHMQQVQCIRAPCPSMPATVTVGEGARVESIDLNEFFAEREGFPKMPPGD